MSHKNKGEVSQFFGQSVTNDTRVIGWKPLAYGIDRNIELERNKADFLWNWNYFSSSIQIYELCFEHKIYLFAFKS